MIPVVTAAPPPPGPRRAGREDPVHLKKGLTRPGCLLDDFFV